MVPALALPSIAVLAIISMVLLLTYAWEATFGQLIEAVIAVLEPVSVRIPGIGRYHLFGPLIIFLRGINNLVHRLSATAGQANTIIWNAFTHHMALAWQAIGESIDLVSRETAQALQYLRDHKIQALITATTGPLGLLIYNHRKLIASLTADVAHAVAHPGRLVTHTIDRVKVIEHRTVKIIARTVPAAVAGAIAIPRGAIHGLERDVSALQDWVKAHARQVVVAGSLGLVIAALGKIGLGWARCSKVGKVGRSVCGMNADYLDDILAASLAIFGTISLVEVAREMQGITDEVTSAVRIFTRAA